MSQAQGTVKIHSKKFSPVDQSWKILGNLEPATSNFLRLVQWISYDDCHDEILIVHLYLVSMFVLSRQKRYWKKQCFLFPPKTNLKVAISCYWQSSIIFNILPQWQYSSISGKIFCILGNILTFFFFFFLQIEPISFSLIILFVTSTGISFVSGTLIILLFLK